MLVDSQKFQMLTWIMLFVTHTHKHKFRERERERERERGVCGNLVKFWWNLNLWLLVTLLEVCRERGTLCSLESRGLLITLINHFFFFFWCIKKN
jgi:hypothetical protein